MPVFLSPLFLPFGHLYLALYLGAYLNGIVPRSPRSPLPVLHPVPAVAVSGLCGGVGAAH